MNTLYKYTLIAAGALCIILFVGLLSSKSLISKYKNAYENELVNIKAKEAESDSLNKKIYAYELTVKDLEYSNDSIVSKMNEVRKQLKIKDKTIQRLEYSLSTATMVDSVVLRDTVFRDKNFQLDTIVGDKWYNVKMSLRYPSSIAVSPILVSERYVFANNVKKTIENPKKCFLLRMFQKKYTTVEISVIEKNPYIVNKKSRYIEVVR